LNKTTLSDNNRSKSPNLNTSKLNLSQFDESKIEINIKTHLLSPASKLRSLNMRVNSPDAFENIKNMTMICNNVHNNNLTLIDDINT